MDAHERCALPEGWVLMKLTLPKNTFTLLGNTIYYKSIYFYEMIFQKPILNKDNKIKILKSWDQK